MDFPTENCFTNRRFHTIFMFTEIRITWNKFNGHYFTVFEISYFYFISQLYCNFSIKFSRF